MNRQQLHAYLQQVAKGEVTVEAAEEELLKTLRSAPLDDLEFANVDHHRHIRCGFPEVIYGEGKTPSQLAEIFNSVLSQGSGCLATRVNDDQATAVLRQFPEAEHDLTARTLWSGPIPEEKSGKVGIVTAGTSDLPVAKEAYVTATVMGAETFLLADVGVAGIHRILKHQHRLTACDCVVVAAGMEGALPSVVGGLVDCPVIAVPTSVGYGASFQGVAALLGMLSSCASNVTVVNIDGGFCGGYVAALIASRVGQAAARSSE